jgi:hypothetical protein
MNDANYPPAVRDYRLLTLFSLAAIVLCLWCEGYETWALLPALPGLLSIYLLSAAGPIFVVFLLTFLTVVSSRLGNFGGWNEPFVSPGGIFLLPAVLIYIATHWRFISLVKQALPGDARRKKSPDHTRLMGRWLLPADQPKRTPERVSIGEIFTLLAQAVLFPLLAVMILVNLAVQEVFQPPEGITRNTWGILLFAWGILVLLGIGHALFTVTRWWYSTPDEARIFLQDQLWSATRSEQRRLWTWFTYQRFRQEHKGDNP